MTSNCCRWALLLLLAMIVSAPETLSATAVNNGVGFGTVSVSVWCFPNAPPAAPSFAAFAGPAFFASAALGPGLAGCDTPTRISGTNNVFWLTNWNWVAATGDSVAGDGEDLFPFLTRTNVVATGTLSISGTVVNSTTVDFTGSYALSDPGVGIRISWFSALDNTMGSQLLFKIGPDSNSFSLTAVDPNGTSDIELKTEVAAVSLVPEPASLMLVLSGCGILLNRLRKPIT